MTNQPQIKLDGQKNNLNSENSSSKKNNPMKAIKIDKITLNIGVGKNEELLKKGLKLLQKISPVRPVNTITKKRIPSWGLRPGLAIGCKATIRKDSEMVLKRLLAAKEFKLSGRNFDKQGNISFGMADYIDIEGLEYDPELKKMGLEVAVTLKRLGYRVKTRKVKQTAIGKFHQITKEEAINFAKEKIGVTII